MNKLIQIIVTAVLLVALSGCGGSDHTNFIAHILSDQPADGDIAFDSVQASYTITNGPDTIFFGIDDSDPHLSEYRAFLDFPLDGSTGYDIIPLNAHIISATIEVFVDEVNYAGRVPTIMDLVSFSIFGLIAGDYDAPPLRFPDGSDASLRFNFFSSDEGHYILIDVTPLLREVQRRGLEDLQVRFVLDYVSDIGFVGIEDAPNISVTAPRLSVRYD